MGTIVHQLTAFDLDMTSADGLSFEFSEPITASDVNGQKVVGSQSFKDFFAVDKYSGNVLVNAPLQRALAAIVKITIIVTDTTAPTLQQGKGNNNPLFLFSVVNRIKLFK